jgi:Calcineurin-like phosphoesterase/RTX calcium-binding nonapeptide repeat (4 copies)
MSAIRPVSRLLLAAALGAACCCSVAAPAEGATLRGDSGRDALRGTPRADRLLGLGGHDRLLGARGNDRLTGGPGRDRLWGGSGRDTLLGETGRDRLIGGAGRDLARGGRGNDTIRLADGGRDRVSCGRGRDRAVLDVVDRIIDASPTDPEGSCEQVTRSGAAPAKPDAFLAAAGDIADCGAGAGITAGLLDGLAGTVAPLGDTAYSKGTPDEFARCYEPTWGRHKGRTRPAVGNHEYGTTGAAGYFDYFGAAAGERGKGWYSYDLGAWHLVALNSNCSEVGGCHSGSEQERWLRADLAENDSRCTVAYMHHPRFSSGNVHGGSPVVEPLWRALHDDGAEIVLAGHEHDYERFAPQTATGELDRLRGVRQFVVGTGGRPLRSFGAPHPNTEARDNTAWGVLHLRLRDGSYDWRFVAQPGSSFTDAGSTDCH